ncbi:MAG TPA: ABC transporter substrate-binding protein [Methylomirabilota bacterium]|nr:ABC transporter substrate-binding protein [Methylomirabilota bacterium]
MEKIRIACGNRGVGTSPLFAAVEGGYMKENGLDPQLQFYAGHPRALPALVAGEAEFTNTVSPDVITINLRDGADVVIVASGVSRTATYVTARAGLTTRPELRGKRWGVLARGDADHCAIALAFERWGWDLDKDAELVPVGTDGPRLDRLLDPAKVDVVIMHSPEPFQAAKRGWNLVEDLRRLDVAFQNSCAATTRRYAKARPDVVLRYVRAYAQGVYRFRADGKFGVEVIRKYSGETDREVLEASYLYFSELMGGTMYPTPEGVRTAAQMLHRLGVIPRLPAPEDVIDQEPVARLHREGLFRRLTGLEG